MWEEKVIYINDRLKVIHHSPDELDLYVRVGNTNTWSFQRYTADQMDIISNVWRGVRVSLEKEKI